MQKKIPSTLSKILRVLGCTFLLFGSESAGAASYDLTLRGLGRPAPNKTNDPAFLRYRSLINELAMAAAPRLLGPAETIGASGFEFAFVNTFADIHQDAAYWQGQAGSHVFRGVASGEGVPSGLWIPTMQIRKGLPFSSELGLTGSYLAFSEMFFLGTDFKIAIHESYYRWVPSFALRASIGSLFNANDVKITTAEIDTITSLPIGISGVFELVPYLGFGLLYVDAISQVIDETPYEVKDQSIDQNGQTNGSLYVFDRIQWYNNQSKRFFIGMKAKYAFLQVAYELTLGAVPNIDSLLQSHSLKIGFDI